MGWGVVGNMGAVDVLLIMGNAFVGLSTGILAFTTGDALFVFTTGIALLAFTTGIALLAFTTGNPAPHTLGRSVDTTDGVNSKDGTSES